MCLCALYYTAYLYAIFTVAELAPDMTYDIDDGKSDFDLFFDRTLPRWMGQLSKWWEEQHWGWKLATGIALIALAAAITYCTAGAGLYGMTAAAAGWNAVGALAIQVTIGIVSSALIGALMAALTGGDMGKGFVNGLVEGIFWTGVFSFAKAAINGIKAIASTNCFAAGTLVLTEEGSKKIEDIVAGDMVWAYDEETGEKALKEVKQVFRNSTDKWCHVDVEGEKETIKCTPEHPYFILNAKADRQVVNFEGSEYRDKSIGRWITAKDLKIGDLCLLSSGKTATIKALEVEHLAEPETTYNFEVADLHNYYVGEQGILVHNACILDELGVKSFNEVGSKYTPDQLIDKLDDLGFSKTIEAARSTTSGPATFMNRGGLEFRIMASPANGNAYFRVMNGFGNYLGASGQVIDNLAGKAFRLATHFNF